MNRTAKDMRSILGEVLVEEFDRCEQHKELYREKMRSLPKGSDKYKEYRRRLRRNNKDMWAIRRALGFSLYPGLRAFKRAREEQRRQWALEKQGAKNEKR